MPNFFKWTIEIEVHKTWVEDGWTLDNEKAKEMVGSQLRYAYGHEYRAKVIKAPSKKSILKTQGGK